MNLLRTAASRNLPWPILSHSIITILYNMTYTSATFPLLLISHIHSPHQSLRLHGYFSGLVLLAVFTLHPAVSIHIFGTLHTEATESADHHAFDRENRARGKIPLKSDMRIYRNAVGSPENDRLCKGMFCTAHLYPFK